MRGMLFAAAFLFCAGVRADTVEMLETGLKLEGKVLRETDDFIILLMKNDSGQVRILKSKIKNIEYDIKTQLEKVAADDWTGKYKVGVWAFEKGMFAEAIGVFEELEGKENIPPDRMKLLGRSYEQREQLDKALEKYSDYLKLKPDDAEVAERVKVLAKEVGPANGGTTGQQNKPKIVDGLEGDGTWVGENWDNPVKAQIFTDPATTNKTIAVSSPGGAKPKAVVTRTGQPLNLSESKEMIFKIFYDSTVPGSIAVAFFNSQGEFHETRAQKLVPNSWNSISVKIDAKDFKTEKSGWKHEVGLEGKERISRVVFMFYAQKFNAHIDSIFFK
ncbi:MAG TPA: tetratricopeptide repeat protein [Planctomycetota bacterium]|nr:tetratricopeptide repeat protein [Planctomycetota bacterium]